MSQILVSECVYATLVPDDTGGAACLYWARGVPGYGPKLTLLDFDVGQLTPDFWAAATKRTEELAGLARARRGSIGIFVESEILTQYAEARGFPVRAIYEHMTKDDNWRGLCAIVMSYRRDSAVMFAAPVREKSKTIPFGAFSFRGGPRPENDATVAAYLYGVVLGLDQAAARPPRPAKVKVVA